MCVEKTPWEQVIDFHGHNCPGIALGFRIATIAQREMGIRPTVESELLVKAYTQSCALDAFQILNRTTIGRGTLMFEEKNEAIYEFHYTNTDEVLKITVSPVVQERLNALKDNEGLSARQLQNKNLEAIQFILKLDEKELCTMERVAGKI